MMSPTLCVAPRTAAVLIRYTDWPCRLRQYLDAQRGRIFQYGRWDCALFVCGAIQAMTGVDPATEFRGKYLTRERGRELLVSAGGFSTIADAHGMREIKPACAHRGDVLLMKPFCLGLMSLDGRNALVMGEYGLTITPAFKALRAWRVGS